jgi:hypothetical protein
VGRKAGELLWNRMRFDIAGGTITVNSFIPSSVDIDTGLTQVNQSFPDMSPGEPGFGSPSRVQVIPMVPMGAWAAITHDEPFLDPATGTIHVVFHNNNTTPVTVNAFFWDPHSMVGPGDADTYNPPLPVLVLARGPGT